MSYRVYDDLRNAFVAELDNTAVDSTNTYGSGTANKVDEWLDFSERAAYREEITRNDAFAFTSAQTLAAAGDRFFFPENYLETINITASVSEESVAMTPTSPDIILNLPTDLRVRLPYEYAVINRILRVPPVEAEVGLVFNYYGSLTPIDQITTATIDNGEGVQIPNSNYLLNELGEWLLYDACLRGGTYFSMDQQQLDRWQALRDEVAMGVYRQERRAKSSGSTPRRNIPAKYTITSRRRRGYF